MAARYQVQLNNAMERLDQGLARVHSLVKRGQNQHAIHYMENDLKELYESLQNIINIEPGRDGAKIGFLE
jgi:division protein CdvB (Snf7/Vps24/ESCRT-III family)